jgi:23S rRNA (cytosine1962-C5)-methyltransferase
VTKPPIISLLERALTARAGLFDARHEAAFRLFNGFYEGDPQLVVDLYARTLVLHNYAQAPAATQETIQAVQAYLREKLPWVRAAIVKTRHATDDEARRGSVIFGERLDRRVREHGVWYAVDLLMNRDAGFYLDTRLLREWAIGHLAGKRVLNTFAYTGSLGVAAMAAHAARVVQMDRNRAFLNVAKESYTLNGFPIVKANFMGEDFFALTSRMRRLDERFDCVFVDPPFFSATSGGRVDLEKESFRILNKVRPLIDDGGWLVAINNALFISGADYLRMLQTLCADGYLAIEELIAVPEDFTGYPQTRVSEPPLSPAPFNHPTKIALLRVRRKASDAAQA